MVSDILVSVICPTTHDRNNELIKEIFEAQDYPNKELIFDYNEGSIGLKRNRCIDVSSGEIILHFDSDDWYAPDYITKSVNHLIESKAQITGLSQAYFYQPHTNLWLYKWAGSQPYVIGSGMCYYRYVWYKMPFKNKQTEEDKLFQLGWHVAPFDGLKSFMAMIHGKNTCSHLSIPYMQPLHPSLAVGILGNWYSKY